MKTVEQVLFCAFALVLIVLFAGLALRVWRDDL